jgi:hypothetical protein
VTALLIAAFVVWLFWPKKTRWTPFGGVFKHDRRTGQLTVAVTLPGKKKRVKTRRKR